MGIKTTLFAAALLAVSAAHGQAVTVPTVQAVGAAAGGGFELDGRIEPLRQSTVAAQVSGNVLQLAVKAGDRVTAGQLLARIDERDVQAGLARGDAAVVQAEAEARNAKLAADRARELRGQGFVSQAALDVAETQADATRAGLQQARAARSQAALARGFASVTAPFAGTVLATHLEAGDLAAGGRPIVTIYAPGELRATVQVSASRALLARGARATEIGLPDGRWIAPLRRSELPGTDAVSQTVEWRLDLPAGTGLAPGQSVRVRFAGADGPQRLTVPSSAVLRRGELTAVYAVQGNAFVLKAVRLGAERDGRVEVLAGLKAGERIAADAVRAGLAGAAVAP